MLATDTNNKATCADDNVKQCDVKQRDQQSDDMSRCHIYTEISHSMLSISHCTVLRWWHVDRMLPTDTRDNNTESFYLILIWSPTISTSIKILGECAVNINRLRC